MRARRPNGKTPKGRSDSDTPPPQTPDSEGTEKFKKVEQFLQAIGIKAEDIEDFKAVTDGNWLQETELHGLPMYSRERAKRVTRQMRRFTKAKGKAQQDFPTAPRSKVGQRKRSSEPLRPSQIAGKVTLKESLLKAMYLMWGMLDVESRFREVIYETIESDSSRSMAVSMKAADFFHDMFLKAYNYLLLAAPVAMLRDANYKAFETGKYALLPLGIRLISTSRKFDGDVNADLIPDCAQWRRINVPGYYDVFVFDCYLWGRVSPHYESLRQTPPRVGMDEGIVPLALTRHEYGDNVSWAMALMSYFLSGEISKPAEEGEGPVPLIVLPQGRADDFCQCLETVVQDYMGPRAGMVAVDVLEYDPLRGPDEKAFENQQVQHSVVVVLLDSTYPPDASSFAIPFRRDGSTVDKLVPVLVVRMNGIIPWDADKGPTAKNMRTTLVEAMKSEGKEAFAGLDPGFDKVATPLDEMLVHDFMAALWSNGGAGAKSLRQERAAFWELGRPVGEYVASQVVSKYFAASEAQWRECRSVARQTLATASTDVRKLASAGDIESFERGAEEVRFSLGECQWVEGLIAKQREPLEESLRAALRSTSSGDLAEFDAKARLLTKLTIVPAWLTGLISTTRAELVDKQRKEAQEVAREYEKQIDATLAKMSPIQDAFAYTAQLLEAMKSAEAELAAAGSASFDKKHLRLKQHHATLEAGMKLKGELNDNFTVPVKEELQRLTAEDQAVGTVGPFDAIFLDAILEEQVNQSLQQTKEELKQLQLLAGTGTVGYVLVSKLVDDASTQVAEASRNRALFAELRRDIWKTGCPSISDVTLVALRSLQHAQGAATSDGRAAVSKRLSIVLQAGQAAVDVQEAMRERRLWQLEALLANARELNLQDLQEAEELVDQLQQHKDTVEEAITLGDDEYLKRTLQQVKEQVTDIPQEFIDTAEQRLRAAPVLLKLQEAVKAIDQVAFDTIVKNNSHLLPSPVVLQDLEEQMQQEIRQIEEILGDVTWLPPSTSTRAELPSLADLGRAKECLKDALDACQATNLAGTNATYDAAARGREVLKAAEDLVPKYSSSKVAYDELFTHLWTEPQARADHLVDLKPLVIDLAKARRASVNLASAAAVTSDELKKLEEMTSQIAKETLAAHLVGPLLQRAEKLLEDFANDASLLQELSSPCWGNGQPDIRNVSDVDIQRLRGLSTAATKRCQELIAAHIKKIVDGAQVAMDLRSCLEDGLISREHLAALDILLAKAQSLGLTGMEWATERRAELEERLQANRGAVRHVKDRLRQAVSSLDAEFFEKAAWEAAEVGVPHSFVAELREELSTTVAASELQITTLLRGDTPNLDVASECLASTPLSPSNRHVQRLALLVRTLEKVLDARKEVDSASPVLAVHKIQPLKGLVDASAFLKYDLQEALRDDSSLRALASARDALLATVEHAKKRISQLQQEQAMRVLLADAKWKAPSLEEISEHDVEKLTEQSRDLTDVARGHFDQALAGALAVGQCARDLQIAFANNDAVSLETELVRARDLSIRGLWKVENRLRRLQAPVACPTPRNFIFMEFDLAAEESSLSIAIIVTDKDLQELDRAYRFVLLSGLSLAEKSEVLEEVDASILEPLEFFCLPQTATLIASMPDRLRRLIEPLLPRVYAHLGPDALDPQSYLKFLGLFSPELMRQEAWQRSMQPPVIKQGMQAGNDLRKVEHTLEITRCIRRQAEQDSILRSMASKASSSQSMSSGDAKL